jgi:hypothetical protein
VVREQVTLSLAPHANPANIPNSQVIGSVFFKNKVCPLAAGKYSPLILNKYQSRLAGKEMVSYMLV